MMGRRARLASLAGVQLGLGGAVLFMALPANAQAAARRRDQSPLYTQVDTGQRAAANARALAAKGNCAAALEAFDQALRSSTDVAVRRDRGLCHEQLGDPFPAMDDYRAYLVAQSNAPDADDIRERLERLETLTGVGGASRNGPAAKKSAEEVPDEPADVTGPLTSDDGKSKRNTSKSYDQEEAAYHKYDDAVTSPLRLGKGAIFGVYGDGRVASGIGGYEIGGSIRGSLSPSSTLYGQIGFVSYESNQALSALSGAQTGISAGGIGLGVGYEFRIRLDQYMTNAILVGALVEYQRVSDAILGPGNLFIPQVRAGYRHVFGHGVGLEFLANVGRVISVAPDVITDGMDYGGTLALLVAF